MSNVSNLKKFFEEQATVDKSQQKSKPHPSKPIKPSHLTVKPGTIPAYSSHQQLNSKNRQNPTIPPKFSKTKSDISSEQSQKLQNPFLEEGDPFVVNSISPVKGKEVYSSLHHIVKDDDSGKIKASRSLTVVPPQLVRKPSEEEIQRIHILNELYDSEMSFLTDMKLLMSIYIIPAKNGALLSSGDLELLFGNVDKIINVSSSFLLDLELGLKRDCIGPVFKKHVRVI